MLFYTLKHVFMYRNLLVLRVGLICNLCYIISVLARYINIQLLHDSIVATIVVLGVVSVFLNIICNIIWLLTVFKNIKNTPWVLGILNLVFLIFQVLNILIFQL